MSGGPGGSWLKTRENDREEGHETSGRRSRSGVVLVLRRTFACVDRFVDVQPHEGVVERAKPMRDVPWRSRAGSLLTINPLPCKMTVTDAPYEAHLSKEDHKVKYPHIASEADMKAHRLKLPTRDLCSGCVPEVLPPPRPPFCAPSSLLFFRMQGLC
jgi:hypothetical protein